MTQVQTTPETLSDALIQTYRQQGFVKIPGIITPEEAEEFRQDAIALQGRMRSLHSGPIFTQLVNAWRESETIRRLTLHPNVAGVAERLAGVPLRIWHDHLLIKQPHNKAATEFHQDRPYWPHTNQRHSLSAWIALVDVPLERGCMTFIPGTQRRTDLRPQNLADEDDLLMLWPDLAYEPRVTLPLRVGDCTFHNGFTAHMAHANATDIARVAHIVIYIDAETVYTGARHPVTDPLGLTPGVTLSGELFPRVGLSA
jgi:ectoine hydroxylase-related dioxygenase (phytanoyl-CoA dioxygenase family)